MKCSLLIVMLAASTLLAAAGDAKRAAPPQKPLEHLLWPKGAPGAVGDTPADKPTLTAWLPAPDKANGAAVVVCPGGGYGGLALDHEGVQVGQWLNSFGVAAFVVKYRLGRRYRHPAPLQDAQRAIRTVRARAEEWKVDPARVGILGFSAGGHLASTAGTHFDAGDPKAPDPIGRQSCRPDFMVLVYPVISFTTKYCHKGSRRNLLGDKPDAKLVEGLSNEKQVTPQTPPTFLIHADGDRGVPPENSVLFYLALRAAKVPAELHIYDSGYHGFGLARPDRARGDKSLPTWPGLCEKWMEGRGLLKPTKR